MKQMQYMKPSTHEHKGTAPDLKKNGDEQVSNSSKQTHRVLMNCHDLEHRKILCQHT